MGQQNFKTLKSNLEPNINMSKNFLHIAAVLLPQVLISVISSHELTVLGTGRHK